MKRPTHSLSRRTFTASGLTALATLGLSRLSFAQTAAPTGKSVPLEVEKANVAVINDFIHACVCRSIGKLQRLLRERGAPERQAGERQAASNASGGRLKRALALAARSLGLIENGATFSSWDWSTGDCFSRIPDFPSWNRLRSRRWRIRARYTCASPTTCVSSCGLSRSIRRRSHLRMERSGWSPMSDRLRCASRTAWDSSAPLSWAIRYCLEPSRWRIWMSSSFLRLERSTSTP